jgi:HK97 family phage major capsid protein
VENEKLTTEEAIDKINGLFEEKMASVPTKDDVANLTEEVNSLKDLAEKSAEIEKAIAKFEGRLEAMNEKAVTPKAEKKSVRKAIGDTFESNIEGIKDAVAKGGKLNLEVKDTTIINNYTGDFLLTDYDSGIDRVERPQPTILSISNVGSCTSKFVTYVTQDKETQTRYVGESVAKIEGVPEWSEISEEVKKIAGYVKVSKEMLEDLAFVRSEINSDLMTQLAQDIDNSLINGLGPSEVTGILNQAIPTFAAGSFAGTIPSANISDVIRVAKAQIQTANYNPTHVLLNPEDAAKIHLTKSSTGEYTYPMFVPADGAMRVAELVVVVSNNIAADTYVVGDFSKFNIRMRNDMAMSVGLDQDDFTRNMVTILAESRLVAYVKKQAKGAFVTATLTTDIAALTPAP